MASSRLAFALKGNGLDLLFGGSPCQPFSQAGEQNGLADVRRPLLFEIIGFVTQHGDIPNLLFGMSGRFAYSIGRVVERHHVSKT